MPASTLLGDAEETSLKVVPYGECDSGEESDPLLVDRESLWPSPRDLFVFVAHVPDKTGFGDGSLDATLTWSAPPGNMQSGYMLQWLEPEVLPEATPAPHHSCHRTMK